MPSDSSPERRMRSSLLETLLEYVTEAQVSVEKEDLSTIRHYHLFIDRGMRLIHNRTDERTFDCEFVPFD